MASNPNQGRQSAAYPDWRKYLQLLVGRVEELEADQTSHPVIGAKELEKWIVADIESGLQKVVSSITHGGIHRPGLNKADILNNTISKLSAVSDFVKRIGDDSYILEKETPLGLHLIIDECIETLEKIGEAL